MHQNCTNAPKHEFRVQWGGSGAFIWQNSDVTSWHELLNQFGPFCTEFRKSTKRCQMHPNCTNAPKHEFRVQWGGSGAFIAKNSDVTSWHELLHQFGPFCTVFRKATKRSQMHQNCTNTPKHESRVQWGGSGAFIAKKSNATSWHELLHQFGPFCTEFCKQPNGPESTKFVRNTPKHEFRVQWVDRLRSLRKIPKRLRGMNFCTSSARFAPSIVSQPNNLQCTKIV